MAYFSGHIDRFILCNTLQYKGNSLIPDSFCSTSGHLPHSTIFCSHLHSASDFHFCFCNLNIPSTNSYSSATLPACSYPPLSCFLFLSDLRFTSDYCLFIIHFQLSFCTLNILFCILDYYCRRILYSFLFGSHARYIVYLVYPAQ